MSIIKRFATSYLAADTELLDTVALEVFWDNPEAVLDLVYGATWRIKGSCVPHDHEDDGGAGLYTQILNHSFGQFSGGGGGIFVGIPIGPPATGVTSFVAISETNGTTNRTNAKRLFCAAVTIPGNVSSVRVNVCEYHSIAGDSVILAACFRPLSAVNFKLGVTPSEVISLISYTTVGSGVYRDQSVTISDLTSLGNPCLDREVEFSLWLHSDVTAANENRLSEVSIVPIGFTSSARLATSKDLAQAQISARELKAGIGLLNGQLAAKIRETYNGLNRSLWGTTPGLSDNLTPDRRRRYREPIDRCHQHQGRIVPTASGGVYSDGATGKATQSFGFVFLLGNTGTPPSLDANPHGGPYLHPDADLTTNWIRYQFRRSIPAGVGELIFRFGVAPSFTYLAASYDTSQRLLASIAITPVNSSGDIVTRLYCGPYSSPLDSSEAQYGFVELEAQNDPLYLTNRALLDSGKKGWNRGAEIPSVNRTAVQALAKPYRVSAPVRAQLTYPPLRSADAWRPTQDCDIKIRFKMIDSGDVNDTRATIYWLKCENAPGY